MKGKKKKTHRRMNKQTEERTEGLKEVGRELTRYI